MRFSARVRNIPRRTALWPAQLRRERYRNREGPTSGGCKDASRASFPRQAVLVRRFAPLTAPACQASGAGVGNKRNRWGCGPGPRENRAQGGTFRLEPPLTYNTEARVARRWAPLAPDPYGVSLPGSGFFYTPLFWEMLFPTLAPPYSAENKITCGRGADHNLEKGRPGIPTATPLIGAPTRQLATPLHNTKTISDVGSHSMRAERDCIAQNLPCLSRVIVGQQLECPPVAGYFRRRCPCTEDNCESWSGTH